MRGQDLAAQQGLPDGAHDPRAASPLEPVARGLCCQRAPVPQALQPEHGETEADAVPEPERGEAQDIEWRGERMDAAAVENRHRAGPVDQFLLEPEFAHQRQNRRVAQQEIVVGLFESCPAQREALRKPAEGRAAFEQGQLRAGVAACKGSCSRKAGEATADDDDFFRHGFSAAMPGPDSRGHERGLQRRRRPVEAGRITHDPLRAALHFLVDPRQVLPDDTEADQLHPAEEQD